VRRLQHKKRRNLRNPFLLITTKSFVQFGEEINDTSDASRLKKILSKDYTNGLELLKRADGKRTNDQKETLETLTLAHFPENQVICDTNVPMSENPTKLYNSKADAWKKSKDLFDRHLYKARQYSFAPKILVQAILLVSSQKHGEE
jgi:hypothetical protein